MVNLSTRFEASVVGVGGYSGWPLSVPPPAAAAAAASFTPSPASLVATASDCCCCRRRISPVTLNFDFTLWFSNFHSCYMKRDESCLVANSLSEPKFSESMTLNFDL